MLTGTGFIENEIGEKEEAERHSFAVVVIETIFFTILLILAVHAPFTIAAQLLHMPFQIYLFASPFLSVMCLIVTFGMQSASLRNAQITRGALVLLGWLFLLGVGCALLALFSRTVFNDEYYYIPNVVYFLDHVTAPMDFKLHFLVGQSGASIVSYNQGTALPYDYLRGVVAYYTHLDYLSVYYNSNIVGFLIPPAYFLLLSRFVEKPRNALIGTFISVALVLISVDGYTFGFQVPWTLAEGKRLFLIIGIPLFTAFSLLFFARPNRRNWFILFTIVTALVGMTASAINLLFVLAIILLAAFLLTLYFEEMKDLTRKKVILLACFYLSTFGYAVLYALLLYIQLKRGASTGDPILLGGSQTFLGQFEIFSRRDNPYFLLTPILMVVLPLVLFMMVRGWQSRFILWWTILLLVLFLNPVAASFMMNRVVVQNIYWRVFFLAPFPLAGAVLAALVSKSHRLAGPLAFAVLAGAAFAYVAIAQIPSVLARYSDTLDLARDISQQAPEGIMLAPPELYGLIPLIDGFHPQIREDPAGNRLWLTKKEARLRENASAFVGGNPSYIQDFSKLLKEDLVQTVVFENAVFRSSIAGDARTVLNRYGFVHQKLVGGYLIVWK